MRTPHDPGSSDRADRAALRLAQLAAALDGGPGASVGAGSTGSTGSTGAASSNEAKAAYGEEWWSDHTRLASRPSAAPPEVPQTLIPEPGRHASRRRETRMLPAIQERWPAMGHVGAQHLALAALAVALVIGATAWWLLRDRGSMEALPPGVTSAPLAGGSSPSPVVATGASAGSVAGPPAGPAAGPSAGSGFAGPGSGASAPTAAGRITVDVVGKVRRPGIVVLAAGSRVVDAIKGAGGARRGVDLSSLNLARVLVDGEQIAVGTPGAASVPAGSGVAPDADTSAVPRALVDLNTATEQQLEALPEVGPVTAQAILDWRAQSGGFTSVDQLTEVQGIGPKTLAQLTPYVTV